MKVDLSKLSHLVNNGLLKKTVYGKLVNKVNAIGASEFVLKTQYKFNKWGLEKKIDDAIEIPSASELIKNTTADLNAVEIKIPDVINLVKKTDYDAKISDIESNYFTTSDYNKYTNETIDNKIKEK